MNLSRPSSSSSASDARGLLYAGFNQDYGCFAAGLDGGFRIYNSDPVKEKMRKDFKQGGISIVEMLFRCNFLALVGGGKDPMYPQNKVIIWDDVKDARVAELEFRSEVKNVKLRKDKIVVVVPNKVYVYKFSATPQRCHTFETMDNDKGLVALSSSTEHAILALLGRNKGHIQIVDLNKGHPVVTVPNNRKNIPGHRLSLGSANGNERSFSTTQNYVTDAYENENVGTTRLAASVSIIRAHEGNLSYLALSIDGGKCASASEKGTLIRVFHTASGKLLNELRRGVDRAEIYSIAFNHDATKLCVSSDHGTVHIFNLLADHNSHHKNGGSSGDMVINNSLTGNRQSSLSFMKDLPLMKDLLPKYFSSEWSFAHFKVKTDCRCICGFGREDSDTIVVICADGTHWKFQYDPHKGGECTQVGKEQRFLKEYPD